MTWPTRCEESRRGRRVDVDVDFGSLDVLHDPLAKLQSAERLWKLIGNEHAQRLDEVGHHIHHTLVREYLYHIYDNGQLRAPQICDADLGTLHRTVLRSLKGGR